MAPRGLDDVRAHEEVVGVQRRRLGLVVADASDPRRQVDDPSRRGGGDGRLGLRGVGEVELGLAGSGDDGAGLAEAGDHDPAQEARTSRDEDGAAGPEVAHGGHATSGVRQHGRVRVAYTLEQCWHDVPGGTAVAALAMARELARRTGCRTDRRLRPAPHRSRGWLRAAHPGARCLPLPRTALYEGWRRLGWPPVERATGPVDVVHSTTIIVPPRPTRRSS